MERRDAIALLTEDPSTTAIFSDFDGSLSEIVRHPSAAAPLDGALETLEELATVFQTVAIVSGRGLEDLRTRFSPAGVLLAGAYGRERSDRGIRRRTEGWESVSIGAAGIADRLPGVVLERKGAGVALHWRNAPEHASAVMEAAEALAREYELELRPGRAVVELVASGPGKGDAIAGVVSEQSLSAAMYGGDDVADVEAFERMRALDVPTVCVAVTSDESPRELAELADLAVPGPRAYLEFLGELGEAARTRR